LRFINNVYLKKTQVPIQLPSIYLVEFHYSLELQYSLIPPTPATLWTYGISGIRGAEALQYPTNFAFRTKVINDACIDRVKRSINYIISNHRVEREMRRALHGWLLDGYFYSPDNQGDTCGKTCCQPLRRNLRINYKRINYNAMGCSLLRIVSASAKCIDESHATRKLGVTLRIRNFGEAHYILVIA